VELLLEADDDLVWSLAEGSVIRKVVVLVGEECLGLVCDGVSRCDAAPRVELATLARALKSQRLYLVGGLQSWVVMAFTSLCSVLCFQEERETAFICAVPSTIVGEVQRAEKDVEWLLQVLLFDLKVEAGLLELRRRSTAEAQVRVH